MFSAMLSVTGYRRRDVADSTVASWTATLWRGSLFLTHLWQSSGFKLRAGFPHAQHGHKATDNSISKNQIPCILLVLLLSARLTPDLVCSPHTTAAQVHTAAERHKTSSLQNNESV